VPDEEAVKAAEELARKITANEPIAVEMTRDALKADMGLPAECDAGFSWKKCSICFSAKHMKKRHDRFSEKRKVSLIGR
jgi:enoyl-CoA hydratase/carnithine racemase